MNHNIRKFDKTQYIVELLTNRDKKEKCYFCKYQKENYSSISEEFLMYCDEKCGKCIHKGLKWKIEKMPNYYRDEYKPLFNWEQD